MIQVKPYIALLKSRLSITVAFSGTFGYILSPGEHSAWGILLISLGGFLLTGAANIVNQLKEIEFDKLMKRTAKRPLPTQTLEPKQAQLYGLIVAAAAMAILLSFNWKAAAIGLISYLLYGYVYTPLKRVGPISVFVGAFPGAFPPMIGWVAATGHFGWEPGILFAIQFFWQFPHFWAIAWVADADYKKAGFKMLPNEGKKNLKTAFTIMIYTLFLIPLGFLPYLMHMTGITSTIIAVTAGILFLSQTFYLMMKPTDKAARWMMFGSFIYLLVVQIAFLIDKA
ncbi:MAG: Protoheme farnesyltransferase [Bacteroidota bacterium]|jgi:protoheme IX farnesyltransferase